MADSSVEMRAGRMERWMASGEGDEPAGALGRGRFPVGRPSVRQQSHS